MTRLFVALIPLIALALLAAWGANQPGELRLAWFGWQLTVRPIWGVLVAGALMALSGFLVWLAMTLRWRARLYRSGQAIRRLRDGHLLGAQALAAVMAERPAIADKLLGKAQALAPNDPIVHYVAARRGDAAARAALESSKSTALLGALARGSTDVDVETLEELARLAPDSTPAWRTLFQARARGGDWRGAVAALDKWRRLDPESAPRLALRRMATAYAAFLQARESGYSESAANWLKIATKAGLELPMAVAADADRLAARRKPREAENLLRRAWIVKPHPALAQALERLHPAESASARLQRLRTMVSDAADSPESRLTVAEAALAASEPRVALERLEPLLDPPARARAGRLALAAYDQLGETPTDLARHAAADGRPEPDWRCRSCGVHVHEWQLLCPSCGDAGTLAWDEVALPQR